MRARAGFDAALDVFVAVALRAVALRAVALRVGLVTVVPPVLVVCATVYARVTLAGRLPRLFTVMPWERAQERIRACGAVVINTPTLRRVCV